MLQPNLTSSSLTNLNNFSSKQVRLEDKPHLLVKQMLVKQVLVKQVLIKQIRR